MTIDPMGFLNVPAGSIITPLCGRTVQIVTPAGPVFQVSLMGLNGAASGGIIKRETVEADPMDELLKSVTFGETDKFEELSFPIESFSPLAGLEAMLAEVGITLPGGEA